MDMCLWFNLVLTSSILKDRDVITKPILYHVTKIKTLQVGFKENIWDHNKISLSDLVHVKVWLKLDQSMQRKKHQTCVPAVCSQEDLCPRHKRGYKAEQPSGWTQACSALWGRSDGSVWGREKKHFVVHKCTWVSAFFFLNYCLLPARILNLDKGFTDSPA